MTTRPDKPDRTNAIEEALVRRFHSLEWTTNQRRGRLLVFDTPGDPQPEPRPRASTLPGKRVRIYVPRSAHKWKHAIRAAALPELEHEGAEGLVEPGVAVAVFLAFRFRRPKSHLRTGRNSGKIHDRAPMFHTQKPDKDNLEKAALDALGPFDGGPSLVWCDDAQVVDGRTSKRWAHPDEEPGVFVAIWELLP